MKVTVKYWAQIKQALGTPSEEIELDKPCSAQDLVVRLAEDHGEPLKSFLLEPDGRFRTNNLLIVGEEQVRWEEPRRLEDGDVVTLLPPISGGAPDGREPLDDRERQVYEWQMWVPGFGEEGQERLKSASVLVTRVGGLGGLVAYELAAAGVGKLILAHAGNLKPSDLNRQLLMTDAGLGQPRIDSARRRLLELNPRLEIEAVNENVSEENVERLVREADVVVDCAPLFSERFLLNREACRQRKTLVECAMFELEAQITTVKPGETPCLSCLHPKDPERWKREFPVFGAVSGAVGCLGAMEAIKVISGLGEPLYGKLVLMNLADMSFRRVAIRRDPDCAVCS